MERIGFVRKESVSLGKGVAWIYLYGGVGGFFGVRGGINLVGDGVHWD